MPRLEFFYDCSSPWTYLAFHRIEEVCAEAEAELVWRPFLVGGVFNTVNPSVYASREKPVVPKARYYAKDLADWARHYGIAIGQPPVFPVNSVKAMRGAFVAEEAGCISPYSRAVFERATRPPVRVVIRVGLDRDDFFRKIAAPDYKARLRENTDELIRRGGFGSPTMFVDGDDMFFGNDRLPLIRAALGVAKETVPNS